MFRLREFPSLILVLMGSLDCVTSVIGIAYFGAVELNPLLTNLVSTNLPVFVVLKVVTSVLVSLIFIQASKMLYSAKNKDSFGFRWTRRILIIAYIGVLSFLTVVVANNVIVLVNAI